MNPSEIEFTVPLDAPLGKQKITISGAITPIIVNVISQDTQNKWLRIITPNGNEKFGQTQPILVEYESYRIEGEPLGILLEDSRGFTAQPPRGIPDLTALKKETLTLFAEYGATPVERYKVKLCAYRVYVNGSPLCDMSDNFFEIISDVPAI